MIITQSLFLFMSKTYPARKNHEALEFNIPYLGRVTHPIPNDAPNILLEHYGA